MMLHGLVLKAELIRDLVNVPRTFANHVDYSGPAQPPSRSSEKEPEQAPEFGVVRQRHLLGFTVFIHWT